RIHRFRDEHRSQLQTEDARAKGRTGKAFNAPIMRDIEPVLSSLLKLLRPGMPKVVPDQWRKFQHDDLLKQLAEDNPIAYSPHRDRARSRAQEPDAPGAAGRLHHCGEVLGDRC
uniref:Transposase n=1 Tax=Macrostomum lignano TaxID=282301 RepID=A0A1I8IKD8_9PLAT